MKKIMLGVFVSIASSISAMEHESVSFNIASTNILDEKLYQELARPQKSGMDWKQREPILLAALADGKQLAKEDIICMQEFNPEIQQAAVAYLKEKKFEGYKNINKTTPLTMYNGTLFNTITPGYYSQFTTPGAEANGFWTILISPKKLPSVIIGIINAHLNNNTPKHDTYEKFRDSQIKEIIAAINKHPVAKNWIICGDFNTDRSTHLHIMKPLQKLGFVDVFDKQPATARSSQGHLKSIDYFWYKGPNLTLTSKKIYPSEDALATTLLEHRPTDKEGTFFTDHAILKAQFKVVPAEK